MALKIKWSAEAKQSFEDILVYLQKEWSAQDVHNFILRTNDLLSNISQQPYIFKASAHKEIRQAIIGKQNSLFYQVIHNEIILLSFWDNRQNPSKNKYT